MKKKLLLSITMTFSLVAAIAQCDYPIPPFPGHVQVNSDQTIDAEPSICLLYTSDAADDLPTFSLIRS